MLITTIPWHIAGLMGQPRRVATFDYSIPFVARMAALVDHLGDRRFDPAEFRDSVDHRARSLACRRETVVVPLRYALAVNPPARVPAALNGFALWNSILLVLMLVAYGYPIGQFFVLKPHSAAGLRRDPCVNASVGVR